jgi:hypothetical protein
VPGCRNSGFGSVSLSTPSWSQGLDFGADLMRNGGIPGLYGVPL